MIYECIKQYNDIEPGTCWVARLNHYMFREVNGERFRYLTPYVLEKFFKRKE